MDFHIPRYSLSQSSGESSDVIILMDVDKDRGDKDRGASRPPLNRTEGEHLVSNKLVLAAIINELN
jgi:hypothetical protein